MLPLSNVHPNRPALFDLQVNGFAGVDFQDPNLSAGALTAAAAELRRHSIHRILLTLITDRIDSLCRKLERLETFRASDPLLAETIAGYHIEGPWLSAGAGYRGAHPEELMRDPRLADLDRLCSAGGGHIRLITLAPERSGSDEVIEAARQRDIIISLGHTDASDADIDRAIAAGASLCTHLGNGVPAVLPRHDNVVQRLLARDELTACFIPDGHHLPPAVLKNFFRAKPQGRVLLTSDCMAAAAAAPGRYSLGRLALEVGADGIVREPGGTHFAGSSLTLDHGVTLAARWLGLTFDSAWALASSAVAERFRISLPASPSSAPHR